MRRTRTLAHLAHLALAPLVLATLAVAQDAQDTQPPPPVRVPPMARPTVDLSSPPDGGDVPPPPVSVPPLTDIPSAEAFMGSIYQRDWVVAVAGNEAIRKSDLDDVIKANRELYERAIKASQEEVQAIYGEALVRRIEILLKVQAGRAKGFDPELVEMLTKQRFDRWVEENGGTKAASELLRKDDLTPQRLHELIEDMMLAQAWEKMTVGRDVGPTGRASVDRFIRPGWLWSAWRTFSSSRNPGERALVGLIPDRVVLQILILSEQEWQPNAQQMAQALKQDYVKGIEDFGSLVGRYSSGDREQEGRTQPHSVEEVRLIGLNRHGSEDLGELGRTGNVGDVVGPLLMVVDGQRYWCLYRLDQRLSGSGQIQPFEDRQLQEGLRENLLGGLDTLRVQRAFGGVLEESYVWPDQFRQWIERDVTRRGAKPR